MYKFTSLLILSSIFYISLISAQSTPVNTNCVFWVSSKSTDDSSCTISNPCSKLKSAILLATNITDLCTITTTRYIYMISNGDYKGTGNVGFSVDILSSNPDDIVNIMVSSADEPADINNVVYPLSPSATNAVINGENASFLIRFYLNSANYNFTGITFANGNAKGNVGYPLYVNEAPSVNFQSCTFQNNRGNKGGVLYYGSLQRSNVSNCQFNNNFGAIDSGAIYIQQCLGVKILNNTFQSNNATQGGAIYVYASVIEVSNNQFTQNNAVTNGGALYVITGSSQGSDFWTFNTFTQNTAAYGAAIYDAESSIRYYNHTFKGNQASMQGGAAFFRSSTSGVFGSAFSGNYGYQGGAVFTVDTYVKGNQLLIKESSFSSNSAGIGGALYCNSSIARMNVDNVFSANTALNKDTLVEYCTTTCLTSNRECGCTQGCGLPPPPVVTNTTETKIAVAIFVPITAILLGLVAYLIWKTNKTKSKMQQRAFDEIRLTPSNDDNEQL